MGGVKKTSRGAAALGMHNNTLHSMGEVESKGRCCCIGSRAELRDDRTQLSMGEGEKEKRCCCVGGRAKVFFLVIWSIFLYRGQGVHRQLLTMKGPSKVTTGDKKYFTRIICW